MRPTAAQMAYIDSLYNSLDVPFSKRKRAQTVGEASVLIRDLNEALEEQVNREDSANA